MAIDYNKFIPSRTTYAPVKSKLRIDYSKFVKTPTQPMQTKRAYFPEHLGGGSYTYNITKPNEIIKTPAQYGIIPLKPGEEGHHIQPVSLGGLSEIYNFKALGKEDHAKITKVGEDALNNYNAGKIGLAEARLAIQSKLQEILLEKEGVKQGIKANIWEGIKETFAHPIKSIKKAIEINPQTKQAVKDLAESTKVKSPTKPIIKDTIIDYTKVIHESWDNAVDKISEAAIVDKNAPKSKKQGKTLEAWTAIAGLAFSPITAAFEASKNLPIIGSIASIINLPLAMTGDAMTNLSNIGLETLVINEKMKPETAENLRQGINEVATLAGQIVVAGKLFKKAGRVKAKEDLTKKYGAKDAETILKTAETRAKLEIEIKPTEKPKVDYNKFIPKKEETTPLQEGGFKTRTQDGVKSVEGKKVNIADGLETFIHKDNNGNWVVSETTSGKSLNEHGGFPTEKAAIEDAKSAVDYYGLDKLKKSVSENALSQPQGITPKKPIEYKPIEERLRTEPVGDKTAGIAKSIEAKAIERGLTREGYGDLAEFQSTTIKDQARAATEMVKTDFNRTRAVVRGEEPLPTGVRGISVIKAMEEVIKKTKDISEAGELARELANSPLATEVSKSAQELSLTRGRTPDSATMKLQEVKKAREAKAKKDLSKKKDIKKDIEKETQKTNLTKEDLSWDKFLSEIEC